MAPKQKKSSKKEGASKHGKNSYFADDKNYDIFSAQLAKLGLELREITGDGNCCFRALSDQMEGNEGQHIDYRKRVCQYMRRFREEFEPFVAALIDDAQDDTNNKKSGNKKLDAFENYIKNLEQSGTYADNGCLVAFARLYELDINIHQINLPIWTINGCKTRKHNQQIRQLHLSYHNGEHYSSIRPLGDKTNTPTNISINFLENSFLSSSSNQSNEKKQLNNSKSKKESSFLNDFYFESNEGFEDEANLFNELSEIENFNVDQIINVTNCHDVNLILENLKQHNNDVESTIISLLSKMHIKKSSNCLEKESEFVSNMNGENPDEKDDSDNKEEKIGEISVKKEWKKSKSDKKREKKARQMERQRIKVLENLEKNVNEKNSSKTKNNNNEKTSTNNTQQSSLSVQSNCVELNINLTNVESNSI